MLAELWRLQELGFVRLHRHPTLPLLIANYTPRTQFEKAFATHPILLQCRGLVLTETGQIVGRGFAKFFNYEELPPEELPLGARDIEITEKMDGSLLIVFRYDGQLVFATRGSFISEQARAGTALFRKRYPEDLIREGRTYLFEYIGPENRIVVTYEKADLIHLACLDTETGRELSREENFTCVPTVSLHAPLFGDLLYRELKERNRKNEEGYIVRVSCPEGPDFRCKIKFEEYCRLHRIVTGVSTKVIWQHLRDGTSLDTLLEHTPDEFNNFVQTTITQLRTEYARIEQEIMRLLENVRHLPTRKEQAQYLLRQHPREAPFVFKALDGEDINPLIWRRIEPEYRQPFADRADS